MFKYLPSYKKLILRENVPRESAYSLEFVFKATNPVMLRLRNEIMRYIWPVGQNGKSRYPLKVEFYEFESHTGHQEVVGSSC